MAMTDAAHALAPSFRSPLSGLNVLVVDDNRVIRDAVAALLLKEEGVQVVATTGLSSETLDRIEQGRPDLILLPALGTRTVELTRAITRRFNGIRVVVFGIKELPEAVTEMIEAGAAGYVREDASVDEFREVVRLAARGEARVAPQIASSLFSRLAALASVLRADERAKNVKLTPRELEILRLVAEGLTNKEIAARLHVEQQTVKNHMHNILERLSLRRRQQAVQYAWEAGTLHKT
ncbi:MAG: response regulator transcription factor [Deltaproteobacteria bacterium]|nr:MAG: response regulator transcription factor [Deltaproteobacteria bacterium]